MTRDDDEPLTDNEPLTDDDELVTVEEACIFLGGEKKPIDKSTYYRGANKGIYPPPVHPSPGISRIVKRKLAKARARLIEEGA
jgi:hypothetical protein